MAIIQAPTTSLSDLGPELARIFLARQQHELRQEELKLRQDDFKLRQQQQEAEAAEQAQGLTNIATLLQGASAGGQAPANALPPEVMQLIGPVLQNAANAQIPTSVVAQQGQDVAMRPSPTTPSKVEGAQMQARAEVEERELLGQMRQVLTKEEFQVFQSVQGMVQAGLPGEVARDIVAGRIPETQLQRIQRIKANRDVQALRDERAADGAATAHLKATGVYPEGMPAVVPGAARTLSSIVEAEKKAGFNVEAAKQRAAITTPPDVEAVVRNLAADLLGQQESEMLPDGSIRFFPSNIGPQEAVSQAVEQARLLGLMTPAVEAKLTEGRLQQIAIENQALQASRERVERMRAAGNTDSQIKSRISRILAQNNLSTSARERIIKELFPPRPPRATSPRDPRNP